MTVSASAADHDGRPLCGGPLKHRDGTCTQTAGWGTPHPGIGRCKLHGGSTGSHVKAAQRVQAERVLRSVWNPNAEPVTDSVAALQRLAGGLEEAVGVLGAQLTVGEPCELCGRGGVALDPVNAGAWTRTVRELRTALSEMERLGIASRFVELQEGQAALVVGAVQSGLGAVPELSPAGRDRGPELLELGVPTTIEPQQGEQGAGDHE
jgi:hypothetical protein